MKRQRQLDEQAISNKSSLTHVIRPKMVVGCDLRRNHWTADKGHHVVSYVTILGTIHGGTMGDDTGAVFSIHPLLLSILFWFRFICFVFLNCGAGSIEGLLTSSLGFDSINLFQLFDRSFSKIQRFIVIEWYLELR